VQRLPRAAHDGKGGRSELKMEETFSKKNHLTVTLCLASMHSEVLLHSYAGILNGMP